MKRATLGAPKRLIEQPGPGGDVLRGATGEPDHASSEVAAWERLERRLAQPRLGLTPLLLALGTAALMTAVLLLATAANDWLGRGPVAASFPAIEPPPAVAASAAVPAGTSSLADGSRLRLSQGGRAAVHVPSPGHTRIELDAGSIQLSVTPKVRQEIFEVAAGGYRFRVVGTEFVVRHLDAATHLDVQQGKVAIYRGSERLRLVGAGESWTSPAMPEDKKPSLDSRGGAGSVPVKTDCMGLARSGAHRAAVECFDREALGTGLSAEIACYEGARLRRDVLGDSSGALRGLSEYVQRYPNGAFSTEAAITIVELLAARGETAAALMESERFLAGGQARERAQELRMVRGRLYQRQGDCGRAIVEYERVASQGGPLAAKARRRRDACLQGVESESDGEAE